MASERDTKLRIKTVRSTQQITRAMKLVAAARIKKAEDRFKAARPYANKLQEVVRELVANMDEVVHPLMQTRPVKRTAFLLVTSDKGLCGAYNNNLLKLFFNKLSQLHPDSYELIVVGSKGDKFLRRRKAKIESSKTGWNPDFATALGVCDKLHQWFVDGTVDEVVVWYTKVISAATQKPVEERILPMAPDAATATPAAGGNLFYEFEPSAQAVLDIIIPRYLQNIIYRVLLEARVSELAARLKAMTNATENAKKLEQELTLEYYRIRQNNITSEILEISGGAEALTASK